ncbi:glycosyltransferase family 2 protein [Paracoccus sp. Ld10]|uniref:glycosyltransferase family 2 protein n=1 Tax=Paracoccus sp. Ld10 TaxID=649158 RepID=UPI00386D5F9C
MEEVTMAGHARVLPILTSAPLKMDRPCYGAVIRAYQCTPLLEQVIAALRAQSVPPDAILVVDSSRSAETSAAFASLEVTVVPYPEGEFNYSRAINVGVEANPAPLTLIISSHVLLGAEMVEQGWRAAQAHNLEIVFWTPPAPGQVDNVGCIVDRRNFNGRNGISNCAALIPTQRILDRPYREEVFAAEDQEWSRSYYETFNRGVLQSATHQIQYLNPNHGDGAQSWVKLLNEDLAIGLFVNRRVIMPDRIATRFLRGVLAVLRRRPERARMHFSIARAYLMANFRQPKVKSRYF